MVQSMLEVRFQLKSHRETRELPVYNLVVAQDGPRTKKSTDQTPTGAEDWGHRPCSAGQYPSRLQVLKGIRLGRVAVLPAP